MGQQAEEGKEKRSLAPCLINLLLFCPPAIITPSMFTPVWHFLMQVRFSFAPVLFQNACFLKN